ncbi:MAG: four helix bundle protein [Planctomycetota bacterium]|nr:four helix bundle protein [Planctomycetota bacterium]MDI6787517.1 four helix bundle protein [Planctomycetota bacterium]
MDKFIFEKLEVYQKTLDFIGKVIDTVRKLPSEIRYSFGGHLIETAISIANNIAEGSGRRGKKEKRQFYNISQGSAFECVPMITVLVRKNFIPQTEFEDLYNICYSISQMLSKLIASVSFRTTNNEQRTTN